MDVWCRCVTAAFYLSDDFRRDTLLSLVLLRGEGRRAGDEAVPAEAAGCRLVQVDGARVIGLAPAEAVTARTLQQAGPHRYCSPRHRIPLNSKNEGST